MRRKLSILMLVVAGIGFGSLLLLRHYATELVHVVVEHAVLQKAPDEYPKERIREAFARRLDEARREGSRGVYLTELKRISHRLEKLQYLEEAEVDELLENLGRR